MNFRSLRFSDRLTYALSQGRCTDQNRLGTPYRPPRRTAGIAGMGQKMKAPASVMDQAKLNMGFGKDQKDHRRGLYPTAATGLSCGGGAAVSPRLQLTAQLSTLTLPPEARGVESRDPTEHERDPATQKHARAITAHGLH